MNDKVRAEFEEVFPAPASSEWRQEYNYYCWETMSATHPHDALWQAWLAAKEKYEPRWLPIETAPKNNKEILACNMRQGGAMSMVYYKTIYGTWMSKGEPIHMQYTHWMPLPSEPSTQGGGE